MNIIITDNKQLNIKMNTFDKNLLSDIMYKKIVFDSNLYEKIDIFEKILKSDDGSKYILGSKLLNYNKMNIIELFIFDKSFNNILCDKVTNILIEIFNKFSVCPNNIFFTHLTPLYLIKITSEYFRKKSKYNNISKNITKASIQKNQELLNFTTFMIDFYIKLDNSQMLSSIKRDLLNIIIDKLNIGALNFIEENKLLKTTIDELEYNLKNYDNIDDHFITKKEIKNKLKVVKKRLNILNTYNFTIYSNLYEKFIEGLIYDYNNSNNKYLMDINEIKIIEIVIKYKLYQNFIYKNIDSLLKFIINIVNNISSYKKDFIIYKHLLDNGLKLFYKIIYTPNIKYDKTYILNNKQFLENVLKVSINILNSNKEYLSVYKKEKIIIDYSILLNIVYKNNSDNFKYIIDTQHNDINIFVFVLLDITKDLFDELLVIDEYDYIEYSNLFNYLEPLFKLVQNIFTVNKTILFTLELKNTFFETVFFVFDKIYSNEILVNLIFSSDTTYRIKTMKIFIDKFNNIVNELYTNHYELLISIYGIGLLEFKLENWNRFNLNCSLFSIDMDLLQTHINQLNKLIEDNFSECIDPICNTFIEYPVIMEDIIVDGYIIYKYVLDKEENPFNRKKLSINSLNVANYEYNNLTKIQKYKEDNKYFLYSNFIKNLKKN